MASGESSQDRARDYDDYALFILGLRRLCGVDLAYYKRRQMERRTRDFANRTGCKGDLTDYLDLLKSDSAALDDYLERTTINVSQLWRNPEHFDTLTDHVLPEIATRDGRTGAIRIWSAGCSYGAEAYTLAAICIDHPMLRGLPVSITASDVDARMIERARDGYFTEEDARSAPPQMLERHFIHEGDRWRASDALRKLVSFKVENVFETKHTGLDLILCRNVAIYFNEEARNELHDVFSQSLVAGGFLMIGATEMVMNPTSIGFERAYPFVYRKMPNGIGG